MNNDDEENMNNNDDEDMNNDDQENMNNDDQENMNNNDEEDMNNDDEENMNNNDDEDMNNDEEDMNNDDEENMNNDDEENMNNNDEENMNDDDQQNMNNNDEENMNASTLENQTTDSQEDYTNMNKQNQNVETTTSYMYKDNEFTTDVDDYETTYSDNSNIKIEEKEYIEYVYEEEMYDEGYYDETAYNGKVYGMNYNTYEDMYDNEDENDKDSTFFNTPEITTDTSVVENDIVTESESETPSEGFFKKMKDEVLVIASEMFSPKEDNNDINENIQTTSAEYLTSTEEFEEVQTTMKTTTDKFSETELPPEFIRTNKLSSCNFGVNEDDFYPMGSNNQDFEIYFMREKKTMKYYSFYNSDDEYSVMVKSVSLNGKKPMKMAKVEVFTFNLFNDDSCFVTRDQTNVSNCEPQVIEANRPKRRLKGSIIIENEFKQCTFVIGVKVFMENGNIFGQKLRPYHMINSDEIMNKKAFFIIKPAENN